MKAILYPSNGIVSVGDLPEPVAAENEVVIRVCASGICHTDIDVLYGRYGTSTYPLVPGHEYAGEIVSTGDGIKKFKSGDRVVVDPNIHCGQCKACKKGLTNLCDKLGAYGVTVNGGFSEFSVVHEDNIVPMPDMSFEVAALAEPVGCVLNGLDAVDTDSMDNALIFGAGPIGVLMALSLRTRGVVDITMLDIDESRLELVDSFGFKAAHAARDHVAMEKSFDFVADATGVPAVAEKLIKYCANGGSILYFGVCPPGEKISVSPHEVFRRQLRIAGTHSLNHNIPEALKVIDQIGPDIERLVSHKIDLKDIAGFLDKSNQESSLKVQAVSR
ncbi:MAG: zinc-dependent alcohol dehydrogenase family protein [Granulosicoccus sp.]